MSVRLKIAQLPAALLIGASLVLSCMGHVGAADTDVSIVLAPSGTLRVGLYPGTPTSVLQPDAHSQETRGVGYDLGKAIAERLGVAYEPVIFAKNADVLDAVTMGRVDMAFTNATAVRAKDMDFGLPYLEIELGYLVAKGSRLESQINVDATGIRVGVTTGSSSDSTLSRDLKKAEIVRATTIATGLDLLRASQIDAFATNKATLFELAEQLPGSVVLDGHWGLERHAIAIPKGRDRGLEFIMEFTNTAITTGLVDVAMTRAGLRGARVSEP